MQQTILIIDDEPGIRKVLDYALRHDSYQVIAVGTGEAALEAVSMHPVDLILLDVGLPDCNGFDLYHRLRKYTAVPIVFLTARHEDIDRIAGLEQGADDYLPKPFIMRELLARIRVILRRAAGTLSQNSGPPSISDPKPAVCPSPLFDLDDQRMIIRYFGERVELTHLEFLILRELILHPGRIFSRGQLLVTIGGKSDGPYDRTIDSHMSAIRAKLRKIRPKDRPIETRRNAGYFIVEKRG